MMSFEKWVDEYFSNSSVDLKVLRDAYNALVPNPPKEDLDDSEKL